MNLKDNNLNLLRLIAAFMVLYAHAFAFYGNKNDTFLNLSSYGGLGISIFFIISGYLIVKSWDSDPVWHRFLLKRCLRIFPALIVVVVLSAVIVGPIFSSLSFSEYFSHVLFKSYFLNIILYPVFALPGVLENARIPNAINGSLWSLPIEFFMYLTVLFIGITCKNSKWAYLTTTMAFIAIIIFWIKEDAEMVVVYGTDVRQYFLSGVYFIFGALFAKFKLNRYFSLSGTAFCFFIIIFLSSSSLIKPYFIMWFLIPYLVLSFGLSTSWLGSKINRIGDYSYGIYIYAFPVQQLYLLAYPDIGFYAYLIMTSLITILFSCISWHFVEKKMLLFKPNSSS